MKGRLISLTIQRWLMLAMAVAAVWPGFLAYLDFFLDDHSVYADDNELTALSLIFSVMPFALFVMALGMLREARILAGLMLPVVVISILITSLPAWFDAYNLGLGASSKQDVDYLEWSKIASWIGAQMLCTLVVLCLDAVVTPALQRFCVLGRGRGAAGLISANRRKLACCFRPSLGAGEWGLKKCPPHPKIFGPTCPGSSVHREGHQRSVVRRCDFS